jgi:hypothetical protein
VSDACFQSLNDDATQAQTQHRQEFAPFYFSLKRSYRFLCNPLIVGTFSKPHNFVQPYIMAFNLSGEAST